MLTADQKHGIDKVVPQVIADLPSGYVKEGAAKIMTEAVERAISHPGAPAKLADIAIEFFELGSKLEGIRVKAGLQPARYYQIMAR